MLKAAQIERQAPEEATTDPYEQFRLVRRLQGWPEYLTAQAIKAMEADHVR